MDAIMSTALPRYLLPDSAETGHAGRLTVGGVDVLDLAETHGTPLVVYDEDHLRARCREAVGAFGDGVAYAAKAFLCRAVARLVHEEGMHIDVSTGGELDVALAAGIPPERLVLHGNNKSVDELRRARELDIRLVVDSFDELERLEHLHREDGRTSRVLLRVTPGVRVDTHEFVMTGHIGSKFGFGLADGDAFRAAEIVLTSPAMELIGVHVHIGSQIFHLRSFQETVAIVARFVQPLDVPEVCLGGGLGVPYVEGDTVVSITEWAAVLRHACWAAGITAQVTAEPGRAIVATGGLTLYRVGTIKDAPTVTYVSVDGGMSDNPRPLLYGSRYECFLPRAVRSERPRVVTVAGKHCENDILIHDARVPAELVVGDVLGVPVTGAYCHSMASNYNKVLRPPVVFVRGGEARVVVRRETIEDLLRLEETEGPTD